MSTLKTISQLGSNLLRLIIPIGRYLTESVRNPGLIRFFPAWFLSNLDPRRSPIKDEKPWVTLPAGEWLDRRVHSGMQVFEYGSGGSTLFYSRRAKRLISVESDRKFHQMLSGLLADKKILNCEYLLREPEPAGEEVPDSSDPLGYSSDEQKGLVFESYVKSIESFPDDFFDLISVDGRARPACLRHARGKLRPGGCLVLDNSERPHYERAKSLLSGWTRLNFAGPGPYGRRFWETTIWEKPKPEPSRGAAGKTPPAAK